MSRKARIKKIDEEGNVSTYRDLQEACKTIKSKLDDWKIQLFIANAMNKGIRAFKCKWERIEDNK